MGCPDISGSTGQREGVDRVRDGPQGMAVSMKTKRRKRTSQLVGLWGWG